MKHLLICREYPPAPYAAGGIGTYARHIARLLAEAGETVHVIGQRWDGAPERRVESRGGRLVVHRLSLDEDLSQGAEGEAELLRMLAWSSCPSQVFSWQTARYAERLIEEEEIDLIEAQEWEAPLYYLQVRRALGLGPKRQPPCVVHLHSPTAMIFEHNGWDTSFVDYLPLSRMEEYSIRAADALICPSEYLARGVAKAYGMEPARIEIVRLAIGEAEVLARDASAWASHAVCYVGRLEPRKGVFEWVDAAVKVAGMHLGVSFDFFGGDTPVDGGAGRSVRGILEGRIPQQMRKRFRFHGARTREELIRALARASIAVVPSRWENLPFSCIEAMASGLPVLVSPHGGMAELVQDGVSGWVAEDGSVDGLASSLLRALATPAQVRAGMGRQAAERVREMCGNEVVVERHLELRRRIVRKGAGRSLRVPGSRAVATDAGRCGIGRAATAQDFDEGLRRLPELLGVVFADAGTMLDERLMAICQAVLERQPGVGLVMPWKVSWGKKPEIDAEPCPVTAGEMQGELPAGCCVRVEALLGENGEVLPPRWETLAAGGWAAVTYPEILASEAAKRTRVKRRYSGMALLQNQTRAFALRCFLDAPLLEKLRWIGRAMGQPGRLLRWGVGGAK